MIARLEGVLREITPTCIVVDVGGVGYEINIPPATFLARLVFALPLSLSQKAFLPNSANDLAK